MGADGAGQQHIRAAIPSRPMRVLKNREIPGFSSRCRWGLGALVVDVEQVGHLVLQVEHDHHFAVRVDIGLELSERE